MDKDTIINQVVNEAYNNLTDLVNLRISAVGGFFGMIIPENRLKELAIYADEIINKLYIKFCNNLRGKIDIDSMNVEFYKSFCYNTPSKNLINDCLEIVNNDIKNKQSSPETTTLLNSLNSLKPKYSEDDISKSLNTIFDILLNYYNNTKK